MKHLLSYLLIVFGLGATINSSASANAWLVLEGINAAVQGGKIATEKIKDKVGEFKSKKNKKKNEKKNIEYQNYLAAIDNCADLEGVIDGWDHRNVCLWAAKQWNINASNPPYLMSKAWAQNN